MADFQAKIQAILDPGRFDAEIQSLISKDYRVKLQFDRNFNQQLSELESKLRRLQGIRIDPFGGSGSGGSRSLNSSLNPIQLQNTTNAISRMQQTLRSLNFDYSAIDAITKNLNDMQIAVRNVRTEINGNDVRITVSGLDELQRTVTIIKELNAQTGEINELKRSFQQTFGIEDMTGRIENSTRDFKELKSTLEQIGKLEVKIRGLDNTTNSRQIAELSSQLEQLKTRYEELMNANVDRLSGDQMNALVRIESQMVNRISEMEAKLADARANAANDSAIQKTEEDYKRLLSILQQIGQTQVKLSGLDTNENANQIQILNTRLEALRANYDSLFQSSYGGFSLDQIQGLIDAENEIQSRVAEAQARMADSQAKAANQDSIKQATASYREMLSIIKEIGSIELKITGLNDETNVSQINALNARLDELKKKLSDLQGATSGKLTDDQLANIESAAQKCQARIEELGGKLNDLKQKASANIQLKIETGSIQASIAAVTAQYDKLGKTGHEKLSEIGTDIQTLNQLQSAMADPAQSANLIKNYEEYEKVLARVKNNLSIVKSETQGISKSGVGFTDILKGVTGIYSLVSAIRLAIRLIKQMANEVKNVDTAMGQLKIVTNATASEYNQFYNDAIKTAKQIGASVSDYITSATTYARLGYSLDESSTLAKFTGMLQNVGDIDVSSAQKAMTAITKAFDVDIDKIESIMDRMVKVGNNAPISVSEIAEGMNNAGSALSAAGNDFDKSVALLTAANTTIQNISKSSTGLRTITARLRKTKTELDDLGEAFSDSEYNDLVSALTGHGVSLKDANGEFRDTYDILYDISKIWDSMSSMDQSALAEKLSGNRQQNVFFSIMTNFKEAENAMKLMEESAGELSSAYGIYLDTVQGKIDKFKASWTELSNTVISSEFLGNAVVFANGLLSALDGIVKTFGSLGTIGLGVGIFAAIKNFSSISTYTSLAREAITTTGAWGSSLSLLGQSLKGFLKTPLGAATAIGLITTAISTAINQYNKFKQEQENLRQEIIKSSKAVVDQESSFEKSYITIQQYLGKDNLTTEQEDALRAAIDSVSEALGGKNIALNDAISKQEEYRQSLIDTAQAEMEAALTEAKKRRGAANDSLKDASYGLLGSKIAVDMSPFSNQGKEAGRIARELMGDYLRVDDLRDTISLNPISYEIDNGDMDSVVDYYYQLIHLSDELASNELMDNSVYRDTMSVIQQLKPAVEEYLAAKESELELEYKVQNGIPQTVEEYLDMRNAILDAISGTDTYKNAIKDMMDSSMGVFFDVQPYEEMISQIQEKVQGMATEEYDKFNSWFDKLSREDKEIVFDISMNQDVANWNFEDWINAFDGFEMPEPEEAEEFAAALHGISKAAKDLSDGYTILSKAQEEMQSGEGMSISTLNSIASALGENENIQDYLLVDENGKLALNVDLWKQRSEAMIQSDMGALQSQIDALNAQNEALRQQAIDYESIAKQMNDRYGVGNVDLTNRKAITADKMKNAGWTEFADGYATLYSSTYSAGDRTLGYDYSYDQNVIIDITPITPDGEVLSPNALEEYVQGLLESGVDILEADKVEMGGLGLVLRVDNVETDLDSAYEAAEQWTNGLHLLQEQYYEVTGNEAQIENLQSILDAYQAVYDAQVNVGSNPLDLSGMFTGIKDVASNSDALIDALETLRGDTALTYDQLAELAQKYPELMEIDGFLQFTDISDQTAALESILSNFNSQFDALIDAQLTVLNDAKAELEASGQSTAIIDNLISNLSSMKDAGLEGLTGSNVNSTIEQFEKLSSAVSKAASIITDSQEEISENGKNSIDTLSSLMDLYGDRWDEFVDFSEDGSFTINTEKIKSDLYSVIDAAENVAPQIKQSLKDALDVELETDSFHNQVDKYVEQIKELQEALQAIKSGDFTASDMYSLITKFPSLARNTKDLDSAIVKLMESMDSDMMAEFNLQLGDVDTAEKRAEILGLFDAVSSLRNELSKTDSGFGIGFSSESTGMQNLFSAIKESVSATGLSAESVSNLMSRYKTLKSFNPASLFESTSNGIHLNTNALRDLENEYEKLQKDSIDKQLDNLVEEYNQLTQQINEAGNAADTAELYAKRADILDQIQDVSTLANQYVGLTSAFNKWQQAQSMGEEGDMYDGITGGLKNIKKLYDDGLVGTNKFRTAVQLMSNEDLTNASVDELISAYEKGYPKMERYFKDSSDGVLNFLNDVHDLNSEWVKLNEDGSWEINFGAGNDQEIADALGINVEAVQSILRKLSDYGFDINLDSAYSDLGMIQTKAESAAQTLRKMGATDYNFNFNTSSIERVDEQIQVASETLDKFRNSDGTVNIEAEGAQEAQYVLATLIMQKQQLEAPVLMSVDTGNVSGEMGETLRLLQQFQTANNTLQMQTAIGADTSAAQSQVDALVSEISSQSPEILAQIGFTGDITPDTIATTISSLTPEVIVGLDSSLVDAFTTAEHDSTGEVKWSNNTSAVDSYAGTTKQASGIVRWGNNTTDVKTSFTATGTVKWTNANKATGTAHIRGTAFAKGNWGTKDSGTAIGGELGQELVVRDGKFFTIGDKGAEFFNYKKGDIIFNASQTREIFEKGKITSSFGRGKVYAEGTAFSSGSGKVTSSGKIKTNSGKNSSKKSSKSGKSSSKDKSDSGEKKAFDWIEVAIERIEYLITGLARKAESPFQKLSTRLNATKKEISNVTKELEIQSKGYTRYLKEANSVKLSSSLKKKVQNGTIDINKYDDDTKKLIDEYKEWYDKAMACKDATEELDEKLNELYKQRFDTIQADFNNQLSILEHLTNSYSNSLDMIEQRGYMGGKQLYAQMQNVEQNNISIRKKELAELTKAMSEANVPVGSEAWYEMQEQINSVKQAIQESEIAIVKFGNSMRELDWSAFDTIQSRISDITSESEFLFNLMNSSDLYQDNGNFSNTGMAQVGLTAMNYDVYMAQADKYASEIKKLNAEIAKDPNNTKLLDRRKELISLQQKSIESAEAEKRSMADLVEEGINIELDALNKLIETYEDSLDSAKDLYDYQKKVSKQSDEISSLRKQLNAYQGDTSEESRSKKQKLKVELSNAEEDLAETQYEQSIKDQKKMLSDLYDEYEATLNSRLDNVDQLMNDMIDVANTNAETISQTLRDESAAVGYTLTDNMQNIWNGYQTNDTLTKYGDQFLEQFTSLNTVLSDIATQVAASVAAGDAMAADTVSSTTPTTEPVAEAAPASTQATPTSDTTKKEDKKKKEVKITKKASLFKKPGKGHAEAIVKKGETYEYLAEKKADDGVKYTQIKYKKKKLWVQSKATKKIGFSQGGYVADMQRLAYANGDDILSFNSLKRGEAVLTPDQTVQFEKLISDLPKLQGLVDMSGYINSLQSNGSVGGTNIGNVEYETIVHIDHVSDYNDFVTQLKNDNQFEKMIQSMTIDRINGGSRLSKQKYSW